MVFQKYERLITQRCLNKDGSDVGRRARGPFPKVSLQLLCFLGGCCLLAGWGWVDCKGPGVHLWRSPWGTHRLDLASENFRQQCCCLGKRRGFGRYTWVDESSWDRYVSDIRVWACTGSRSFQMMHCHADGHACCQSCRQTRMRAGGQVHGQAGT